MKTKLFLLASAALAVVSLSACNTIRGAGRDVSAGGEVVSDAASKVQSDLEANKAKQEAKDAADARAATKP
jgi:entericidin B